MPHNGSTGPRTEAGKAVSSTNALKHGLASGTILIAGEDPEEFLALEQGLLAQYQPTDLAQTLLVNDMAKHHWLKDRALRLQGEALAMAQPGELPPSFSVLLRYQTTNECAFYKALTTLLSLRKQQLAKEKEDEQFVSQQQKILDEKVIASVNAYIYGPMPGASERHQEEESARLFVQNAPPAPDSPGRDAAL